MEERHHQWNCANDHEDCRRRLIRCLRAKAPVSDLQKFADHGILFEPPPEPRWGPERMYTPDEFENLKEEEGDVALFTANNQKEVA